MISARSGRWFAGLAWAVLALSLARFAVVVAGQLAFPLDLEFETLQLRTVRVIESGRNLYGPETYANLPYVFSVYTPLYHELVAALPAVPGRPFLVGRLLALAAMLAVGIAFFFVDGSRTRREIAALACGWFFLLWPITGHSAYMRQEPLALLCSAFALLLLAQGSTRAVAAAAVSCLLALGFKQSYVVATLTGLVYLLLARRPRQALVFAGVFVGLGAVAAGGATLRWGRDFWFCTIAGTVDAWSGEQFWIAWRAMLHQPAFVALLVLAAGVAWAAANRGGRSTLRESPYPTFALLSLLFLVATVGKIGSHTLYFLELILALLMWLAFELGRSAPSRRAALIGGLVALALTAQEVAASRANRLAIVWPDPSAQLGSKYATDVRAALAQRGLSHPRALNLGPMRAVGAIADDYCVNDAALYERLFRTGKLSPEPLILAIRRRAFDVVLLTARQPVPPPPGAVDPMSRVVTAVCDSYRFAGSDMELQYFLRDP